MADKKTAVHQYGASKEGTDPVKIQGTGIKISE
jgi:hypothetical protein